MITEKEYEELKRQVNKLKVLGTELNIVPKLDSKNNIVDVYLLSIDTNSQTVTIPEGITLWTTSYPNLKQKQLLSVNQIYLPSTLRGTKDVLFAEFFPNVECVIFDTECKLTELEDKMFYRLDRLLKVKLPSGLLVIGEGCFSRCSLTEIDIPYRVKRIGDNAFANTFIDKLVLPKDLSIIDRGVFTNCSKLLTITIPDNVIQIDDCAFLNTPIRDLVLEGSELILAENSFNYLGIKRIKLYTRRMRRSLEPILREYSHIEII